MRNILYLKLIYAQVVNRERLSKRGFAFQKFSFLPSGKYSMVFLRLPLLVTEA